MDDFKALVESMNIIQSQEQLLSFEVSSITKMKDSDRSKAIKGYKKQAEKLAEKKVFTTDQLFNLL